MQTQRFQHRKYTDQYVHVFDEDDKSVYAEVEDKSISKDYVYPEAFDRKEFHKEYRPA